jgi:fructokinase
MVAENFLFLYCYFLCMGKKIVAFGELIWDVFQDGKKLGGAPANLVYRVDSLGDEGFLLSRVGQDEAGREALQMLKRLNVTDQFIQIDPVFPTGMVMIKVGHEGRPDYLIEPDLAFDHIEPTPASLKLVKEADCLCFGTLVQRHDRSRNTLKELLDEIPQTLKYLDLKLRKNYYTKEIIEKSLTIANILRVKENELYFLKNELSLFEFESKSLAEELINEYNLDIVLVTQSKAGAFALDKEGRFFEDRGYIIELVDTVGSGVAFSAGFLHVYLEGHDLEAALRFGNAAGALNAETQGATHPISRKQILELMNTGARRET